MNALALRVGAATLAVTWITATAAAQQMERGSYLRKPANSRAQLIAQLESDPIVSARYQKHFGMSEDEVRQYFATLQTTKVSESGRYLVWHVDPDGTMETKWLNLKKGTLVFADPSGRPILKLNCGNPLVDQTVAQRSIPKEEVAVAPPPPVETFVAETPPTVAVVPPPAIAVTEVVAVAPPPVPVEEVAVVPPPAIEAAPQVIAASGGGGGIGALPLLLLAPLAGGIRGGGGGGGTAPVPEPTTLIAFGLGAVALAARRRRKTAA